MKNFYNAKTCAMKSGLMCASALAGLAFAAPSFAQQVGAGDDVQTETADPNIIIVSARKREESLQEVPLAVTAIGKDAIENSFAQTVADLERFAPNVDLADNSYGAKQLNATIRGVGFADVEKSFEPAIGFSIDGVFLGTSGGAAVDVFDLESVEILRGPQGTLYGRNTVGGVINLRRTRPTEDLGARATVRLGNNGRQEYLAVANTGRIGDFALKGYFFKTLSDTYSRNLVTGEKDRQKDSISFGGALSFEPSEDFSALLSVDIFDDNSGQSPAYNLSTPGALFCDLTLIPAAFGGPVADSSAGAGCIDQSYTLAENSNFTTHIQAIPVVNETDGFSITGNIDWDVSDTLTLSSVTGYRESEELLRTDNLGAPLVTLSAAPVQVPLFFATRAVEQEQFSQELRLGGTIGSSFDFVTGLYYLNSTYNLVGGPGPFGQGFGTVFIFGGQAGDFTAGQKTEAYAAFADGSYEITDKLTVSAGVRYSYEEKDFDLAFFAGAAAGQATSLNADFDALTGRVILQYQLTDDIMAFGGWSRGFRSGGFNGRAASIAVAGPYDPETVDSFEGGLRMELLDRRLRFNPTAFYANYRNKQEEVSQPSPGGIPETVVQNAGTAKIWGLELETQAVVTDELNLRGSVGYLNAKYGEFLIPDLANPGGPDLDVASERQLRRAPDWTFALGATYTAPLTDNINFIATTDFSFMDSSAANLVRDTSGLNRDIIDSVASLDYTIGLKSDNPSGVNWSLTAYMIDATDGRNGRLASTLDVGVFYFATGAPTTRYGLEFGIEF
ncbi:TonB-dependent receptor [Parasphingorhabdus sp.]|uniref:TonB-dependent receptor n=1 Tax=Parasphingorhabdus sp. TaxID=2709688 RepID=UPI0032647CFE